MNRTLTTAEIVAAENVHNEWIFGQWLDLSAIRLYKHPIKSTAKDLNPAIEEMNTEICERIS